MCDPNDSVNYFLTWEFLTASLTGCFAIDFENMILAVCIGKLILLCCCFSKVTLLVDAQLLLLSRLLSKGKCRQPL